MKHLNTYHMIVMTLGLCLGSYFMCSYNCNEVETSNENDSIKADTIEVKKELDLLSLEPNVSNMYKVCIHYGVEHPEIVTAQAILESGNFKSKVFNRKNNPFGLYNSSKGSYFYFSHWTESVLGYKNMIQNKYKGGDYYKFLADMKYAEDERYISKVRNVADRLKLETID